MCYDNKCIIILKNLEVNIENHAKALQVDVEHLQKKNLENHANQINIVTALQVDVERNLKNHANQQTNIVTALQVDVERNHLQQERLLKHIRIFHQRVG
jgi:predicted DNA-binding ribbon-helix-helix protein